MVAHEYGRGAAFLGGYAGCWVLTGTGVLMGFAFYQEDWGVPVAGTIFAIGLLGVGTVDIWSIVDAMRVAKVNNLAWRDRNNIGFNLQLEPFILPVKTYGFTNTQVGLSLKVNF